jgi:hypothetical protein
MQMFKPTYAMCDDCPCHDPEHPLAVHHQEPCCCPHRYLVQADCPDCLKEIAAYLDAL